MSLNSKKGLVFSSDLLVAILILLVIFIVVLISWNSFVDDTIKDSERKNIESLALKTSDNFVLSEGFPKDWEKSNASVIGLVSRSRNIDPEKLNAFLNLDYEESKRILGLQGYEYQFRLNRSGIVKPINSIGKDVSVVRRVVLYNGEDILEFYLWKE